MREAGLPLTLNAVLHRQNLHNLPLLIDLALAWGAARLEVAHVQYYGRALANRDALLPTRAQLDEATRIVTAAREAHEGRLVIDYVVPDYHAARPKAWMVGWGQRLPGGVAGRSCAALPRCGIHRRHELPECQGCREPSVYVLVRDGATILVSSFPGDSTSGASVVTILVVDIEALNAELIRDGINILEQGRGDREVHVSEPAGNRLRCRSG